MITAEDGRFCPIDGEYFNPWHIRNLIANGESVVFCISCRRRHDIDDLLDSDDLKEVE